MPRKKCKKKRISHYAPQPSEDSRSSCSDLVLEPQEITNKKQGNIQWT